MIASIFSKSRPFNYVLITCLLVLGCLIYQFVLEKDGIEDVFSLKNIFEKVVILLLMVTSLFVTNFIALRNGLSKDNSFSLLFYFLFVLFIPSVFDNLHIVLSAFFILLAMRRLISMKSLVTPKEKIFDASLWIFIAALFHFWSILFIVVVFVSIIFHVLGDYRNWILPFIAFFAVGINFVFFSLLINPNWLDIVWNQTVFNVEFYYLKNSVEDIALVLFALFAIVFLISMVITLSKKPINMQSSFKKVIFIFLLSGVVYLFSPEKSNDLLLFGVMPLSILATSYVESVKDTVLKEIVTAVILVTGFFLFIFQL